MATTLYFAYGSNLHQADVHQWCRNHGHHEGLLQFQTTATLPDFDLGFTWRSDSRNGGVLDVQPRRGQLVPGVVFAVHDAGWEALDAKEGAPRVYERIRVTVLDARGCTIEALTYRVRPEKTTPFVAPSEAYLDIVRQGLATWDLPATLVDAAARKKPSQLPDAFFFYGTLLRGEPRFDTLLPFGIQCILLAQAYGRLVNLGPYPGMVDLATTRVRVHGEFVRVQDPAGAIQALDAAEGFRGYGQQGSLYQRTSMTTDIGEGRLRQAWTYVVAAHHDHATPIPSGDWRTHLGSRQAFLQRLTTVHAQHDEHSVAEAIATGYPFLGARDRQTRIERLMPLHEALSKGVISERQLAQASGNWKAVPSWP